MSPDPARKRDAMKRNHLIWIGPLVAFAAVVSYFEVFARFPALRDFPWVNLPLVVLGAALSALGVRRAFGRSLFRGKTLAAVGLALSLLITAAFFAYVFWLTYFLPPPSDTTLGLVEAPDFRLAASTGETVRLSDFEGRKVALVFYRGFW